MPPSPSDGRVVPNIQVAAHHISTLNNSSTTTASASANDNSTTNDAIGNGTNINLPTAALTTAVNNAATYPINTVNTQGASHTMVNVYPQPQFYNHQQNVMAQPVINGVVTSSSLGSANGIYLAQPQLLSINTQQLPSNNTNTIVHPHPVYIQPSILPIQPNNSDVGTSPNTSNSLQTTNNTSNADESTTTNTSNSLSTAPPSSSIVSSKPDYNIDNPNLYTQEEEDHLQSINDYCWEVLPIGTIFKKPLDLKNHVQKVIGDKFGFVVSLKGSCIECLNADAPAHEEKRTMKRQQNVPEISQRKIKKRRLGCKFKINFAPALPGKDRDKDDKSVRITKAEYLHSNGCRPSSQQLSKHHVVSGTFTRKNVSHKSIESLLNMMRYSDHVEAKTIRNILKEILPEEQKVDAALIANVRARAKLMLSQMEKDEYGKLKHSTITTEDADKLIGESIDDATNNRLCGKELNDTIGLATQELKIMLSDALEKGKELDQIICLLSQAKASDPGFDFRVAKNKIGKIVGLCWQDGIMRGHCQGGLLDVVMLDMMKRQQNTADWPYCGPVLITGENKVACACEAIVLSEGTSYYSWIMNSVYDMSGVDRSEKVDSWYYQKC